MSSFIIKKRVLAEANGLAVHPILQRVYSARGVLNQEELEYDLKHLMPFTQLKGIQTACELLAQALYQQKRILIVGDFDADGATSSALGILALKALGAKHVSFIVPNRFEYGYGLTPEIIDAAATFQPEVLITVDNGISSIEGVAYAKSQGIQVIITDHHLPGTELPAADAIVNPNQPNCSFPSKNLAGVGVVFYLMLALRAFLREQQWFVQQGLTEPNMAQFLDLVALGTYADVVPLDRNNRILVAQGLKRIRAENCRPGILAILRRAKKDPKKLETKALGFIVGPRLNAAGRLDDMSLGIECLLAENYEKAYQMAEILDELNLERQAIEEDMKQTAIHLLKPLMNQEAETWPVGICLYDPNWHQGVIGILAGRMKDKLHKPVIAFAPGNTKELKGSARSIEGIHIRDILDLIATRYPHLLKKFGGHAMAAGLTIAVENFQEFSQVFDKTIQSMANPAVLERCIWSDGPLEEEYLTLTMAEMLEAAGPFGQAFPEPLFDDVFQLVDQRIIGQKHLKMTLRKNFRTINAIAFSVNLNKWPNTHVKSLHITYRLAFNDYQGIRTLQLLVEHFEPVEF